MPNSQDDLIARLMAGEFGPWAGQGFVPGGITILRPDTGQWETITAVPGDADLTESVVGPPQNMASLLDPTNEEMDLVSEFLDAGVEGLPVTVGIPSGVGGGGGVLASVVPAGAYTYLNFVTTDLGEVRLTQGDSNGVSGPLSPILMGTGLTAVDKDGAKWLPEVRMTSWFEGSGPGGEVNN